MKSKHLIWILAFLVFGSIAGLGFLLRENHPVVFYVTEGLLVFEVALFVILYKNLLKPYRSLSHGVRLLREQDFSTRLSPVNNPEANNLIEVFNQMMDQLRSERLLIREKNQFLDLLINASPLGFIILDLDEYITEINPAGLRLLSISDMSSVGGKSLQTCDHEMLRGLAALDRENHTVVYKQGPHIYRCIRSTFVDRGFNHPFILIEELTGEMLKAERKSYESIIRMMSHEVNNSVAAISATLEVLGDVLRSYPTEDSEDIRVAVEASADRCVSLTKFVDNLAGVVKIPEPCLSDVELNELVSSVAALTFHECQSRRIEQSLTLSEENPGLRIDGIQFEQILLNIIKNAYESIGQGGEIRIATSSSPAMISVEDNGPGIPEEVKDKLFTPFFTTKTGGQGIGLMFIREVLLNHGCTFSLATEEGWTKFRIYF